MTLRELLHKLDDLDDDATIFAGESPLTLSSRVVVAIPDQDENGSAEADGCHEVMDVWHARETIQGLSQLLRSQLGRNATPDELEQRFMLYLKNDA